MKKINKIMLISAMLLGVNTFADDIWFISPQYGQPVSGQLKIQVHPPYQQVPVHVWIEYDMGPEYIVWRGQLTPQNNYTMTVNTSKFQQGRYSLEAEYYLYNEDYDGEVDFWIGGNANSQYFPPAQPPVQ